LTRFVKKIPIPMMPFQTRLKTCCLKNVNWCCISYTYTFWLNALQSSTLYWTTSPVIQLC